MKRFIKYITEAPKDLVQFAQRYARRPSIRDAKIDSELYKRPRQLNIPIPGYDEKHAMDAEHALSRFEDRIIGQEEFSSGMQRVKGMYTGVTLPIKALKPIQPTVEVEDPKILKAKIEDRTPENVRVFRYRGDNFVQDGHHSILGAILRGDKEVHAQFLDIGGAPRKPNPK